MRKVLTYSGIRRHSVAHFLGVLTLTIIVMPFLQNTVFERQSEAILFTLMLISAVLAVGGRRKSLIIALVLMVPALSSRWIHEFFPTVVPREVFAICGLLFVGFVIGHLLRYILTAQRVNSEVICAAIAVYVFMAILWAFAYTLIDRFAPGSYSYEFDSDKGEPLQGFKSLYFSFTTMSTGGYGDIVPVAGV